MSKSLWRGRVKPLAKPLAIVRALVTPSVAAAGERASRRLALQVGQGTTLAGSVGRILERMEPAIASRSIVRDTVTAIVASEERGFGIGVRDGSLSGDVNQRKRAKAVLAFGAVG